MDQEKRIRIEIPEAPLAERMRPRTLDGFAGQDHLLGEGKVLRLLIEQGRIPSMVFWGEPGTGKTTLAGIIANNTSADFVALSAVSSGVSDVRRIIKSSDSMRNVGKRTILFIDEIHRFNKAQQDALLHAVENGTLTLIGATTENPSFEVISPLLSRCKVFKFERLSAESINAIVQNALSNDAFISKLQVTLSPDAMKALLRFSGGDARSVLTSVELAINFQISAKNEQPIHIDSDTIEKALLERTGRYDKKGDFHYDVISAFIKSIRGSDPDGAIYWLARMLKAGEDPKFVARRLVILASEDIGNANPTALVLANSCSQAVQFVGMPEAQLILAQTVTYLASSPKSNASMQALFAASKDVDEDPERPVPLHLRNAPTGLMKGMDYGKGYQYAHDFPNAVADQNHLPEGLEGKVYYHPTDRGAEKAILERLKAWWPGRKWKDS